MKKSYLVIAFGLSALLFAGIFLGSLEHYKLKDKSRSPFLRAVVLHEPLFTENNKIKTLLTKDGEYLVIFSNSNLGATKHKKIVENGNVYVTGYFANTRDLRKSLEQFELSEERYPITKARPGQIQVGEHLVHYGEGSALISRDAEEGITDVYAIDHEIRVFYEGAEKPFVIPPQMKITLVDAKIGSNTTKLYYSKLRKKTEFRLQTYREDVSVLDLEETATNPSLSTAHGKIDYAVGKRKKVETAMETYVENYIPFLQKHSSESFFGKITFHWKTLQSKLSLIKPKKYKDQMQFLSLVQDFIDAVYAVSNDERIKAENKLARFLPIQEGGEWDGLLESSPEIRTSWFDFSRAQSSLLRKTLPEEDEYVFYNFWFGSIEATPWEQFKSEFFAIQNFIDQQSYDQTPKRFERLSALINNLDPASTPAQGMTDYRRLLTELLKYDTYFKEEKSIFESLIRLSEKEVLAYEDDLLRDEVTLEIAQDTLYFLRHFLGRETINQSIIQLLEQRFKSIDIAEISDRIGRSQIFSSQELEIIQFISCAGSTGLTAEKIKRCKEEEKKINLDDIISFDELQTNQQNKANDWKRIENNKDFKAYMVTLGINTVGLKFQNSSTNKNFLFSGAYFDVHRLRGIFNYNGQFFERTSIGDQEFKRLTIPEFERALHSVRNKIREDKPTTSPTTSIVPQTTPEAKYQRLLLLKMLEKEGFSVSMEDIKILDVDFETFRVSNAVSPDRYIAEFVYHKAKDFVSDIRVKYGSSTRNFRHIKYPFSKLRDELDDAILPQEE